MLSKSSSLSTRGPVVGFVKLAAGLRALQLFVGFRGLRFQGLRLSSRLRELGLRCFLL